MVNRLKNSVDLTWCCAEIFSKSNQLEKRSTTHQRRAIRTKSTIWHNHINVAIELVEHNRCQDPSLATVLNALRTGVFTDEAFRLLQSRYLWNPNCPTKPTLNVDTTCVYEYNILVNEHNFIAPHLYAHKYGNDVYRITSDTTARDGTHVNPDILSILFQRPVLESDIAKGIIPHIDFYLGMSVCVYQGNSAVKTCGIGNGTKARIVGVLPLTALEVCSEQDIQMPLGSSVSSTSKVLVPNQQVTHLLLQLPLTSTKSFRFRGLPWNVYPLERKTVQGKVSRFKHRQFPVRAMSAVTPYKVQGATLPKVASATNVGENHLYVVASRVRFLKDLVLLHPFVEEDKKNVVQDQEF